ncbi:MAG: adenylate/guanylate cyclase domain-containing protein [bacterium]|nr:adenylate/guanylate cyclase domain-containing protein [bacterium]
MEAKFKKKTSIQLKFSLAVILLIIAIYLLIGKVVLDYEKEALTSEAKKRIVTQLRFLAQGSQKLLLQPDPEFFLSPLLKRIMDEDRDILYAVVVDAKGKIKGHPDMTKIDTIYYKEAYLVEAYLVEDKNLVITSRLILKGKEELQETPVSFHVNTPIYQKKVKIGTVYLGFSKQGINKILLATQNKIITITLIALVIGIIGSIFLVRFIIKPLKALAKGAQEISREDFDIILPIKSRDELGELTFTFNQMVRSLKEKQLMRYTFERYVTKEVADTILKNIEDVRLGGEQREVTTLFADIRGWTQITKELPAEKTVHLLNDFFTLMVEVVFKYEGTLAKFMGDGLMAIFGAPLYHEDDALRAVKTALEMKEVLSQFNKDRKNPIDIGVGITSGEVIVGNIGSEKRMEYTAVGARVNLAARLQALAEKGQILLDKDTYLKIADSVNALRLEPIMIKGLAEPMEIYEARDLK